MENEHELHPAVDELFDSLPKTKEGKTDWVAYQQTVDHLIKEDPDTAELLLAKGHPILLHEEDTLERLNAALQEKYGRNSYLHFDGTGKHIVGDNQ